MNKKGENMETICARCGKKLKNPVWIGGKPYGKTCAQNIGKPLTTTKSTGRSEKKQNRKVEDTESLDAFLAKPIVEY